MSTSRNVAERRSAVSQTRTSSLGAARPLPPSADIGPGGQSVGSTSPNARRCTRSRLICRRRSSRISNCRTGWRARRERGLMRRSSARCRTIARSTRSPGGTTGFGRLIHYRDVFDKRSWTRLSPAPPPPGDLVLPAISAERPHRSGHFPRAILVRQNLYARSDKAVVRAPSPGWVCRSRTGMGAAGS